MTSRLRRTEIAVAIRPRSGAAACRHRLERPDQAPATAPRRCTSLVSWAGARASRGTRDQRGHRGGPQRAREPGQRPAQGWWAYSSLAIASAQRNVTVPGTGLRMAAGASAGARLPSPRARDARRSLPDRRHGRSRPARSRRGGRARLSLHRSRRRLGCRVDWTFFGALLHHPAIAPDRADWPASDRLMLERVAQRMPTLERSSWRERLAAGVTALAAKERTRRPQAHSRARGELGPYRTASWCAASGTQSSSRSRPAGCGT